MRGAIPVTVIIVTKNEERAIVRCLNALADFSEIIVVDSASTDRTKELAAAHGAQVMDFTWNGRYPKKRQWCLDNLPLKHDWIFFVDADEVVTPELVQEIKTLDFSAAGYFVKARYVHHGKFLKHGLRNNKLCLIDRRKIEFPVIDDLDLPGMGEIEGHYQPVLKEKFRAEKTGVLKNLMLHYACEDRAGWQARHERYARWEAGMNKRRAWPRDPVAARRFMKALFKASPLRPCAAFAHCYILKRGFLDGGAGLDFALSRCRYYRLISAASKNAASAPGISMPQTVPHKSEH